MNSNSAFLLGIARVLPDICTFVTPIFATIDGELVSQVVDKCRVQKLERVFVGDEFRNVGSRILIGIGGAALYGFEFPKGHVVLGTAHALAEVLSAEVMKQGEVTQRAIKRFCDMASGSAPIAQQDSFVLHCMIADSSANESISRVQLFEAHPGSAVLIDEIAPLLQLVMSSVEQFTSFLDATETGLQLINAILKEPARSDGEFRKKLSGLFSELHSIKSESSALNLMSVAHRVHALEDMVNDLKRKAGLSGSDFLPVVLKFDGLLSHLHAVREMASRLVALQEHTAAPASTESNAPERTEQIVSPDGPAAKSAADLSRTLHALAERLARDHHKRFKLKMSGLSEVPPSYISTVMECVIQMLRNSAVHGIETSEVRRAQTKDDVGIVLVDFRKSRDGYELVCEDDGAGMSPDQLKAAAVRKQILTEEEAADMDTRSAMALIFRAGFSTLEEVSMDGGRGVGMDVVARSVYALGGKIGVSTNPGKFTRFKIVLPLPIEKASFAVA